MKFHDTLNEKLWDNFYLKKEVSDKLGEIAEAFIDYAEIPEEAIEDIQITGSSANYNYTPYSDLDLHIIVDYDKIHEDCPIVEGYLWSTKANFNKEHDIFIYGIPVELYAEDSKANAVSNGVYSLAKQEWIKEPKKLEPTDNDEAVKIKFEELKEAIDRCDDSETAQELLDKIYAMRKAGLSNEGELSTENLAFKKLRDYGALDKLKEIKRQHIDEELSLSSRIKRIETKLASFTEEPDAFEDTHLQDWKEQEEKEDLLYKEQEKQNRIEFFKNRNIDLNRLKKYFDKFPYTKDVKIVKDINDGRFRYLFFWIPERYLGVIDKLRDNRKLLGVLEMDITNATKGYNVILK